MGQNKLKLLFGVLAIVFAVVAVALLLVGILAVHFDEAALVKVLVIIISVICFIIAAEMVYMFYIESDSAPNYFLYNAQTKRNIPVQKMTFQVINSRMNRYLSGYAPSEGKLWTERIFDNPYLEMDDKFKPAVAYKLLYDLAERDSEQGWKCFEIASEETVEFLCTALEMNYDTDMARTLRQMKTSAPLNLKYVRDYIVKNRNYLKSKLCHYIYDNIQLF
ncbi:MAG: hypothetical protein E7668_00590 [Ruminococcaceae bacterium]|nr:hypothetical protein [Oscillospiraceae bacterium]